MTLPQEAVEIAGLYTSGPRVRDRPWRALGIETSCDDTAAAVVDSEGRILSEAIRGQHRTHEPSGGIVPILALQKHIENTPYVVQEAMAKSGLLPHELDAVAVTRGPGISSSLSVGFNAAKTLAAVLGKPLVGVHHMEAHALTARLCYLGAIPFPFLTLLISGGHTLLLVAHAVNHYTQLGTTRDDSVGDAFDKVARALQLPWKAGRGGGPGAALEDAARRGDPCRLPFSLTVPMSANRARSSLDFSFSGLKADVFRRVHQHQDKGDGEETISYPSKPQPTFDPYNQPGDTITTDSNAGQLDPQFVFDMAAAFQTTATEHLTQKVRRAFQYCASHNILPTTLVVSGGVASNQYIREQLRRVAEEEFGTKAQYPPPHLCTDNGVMIAWAGLERLQAGLVDDYGIGFLPRWPIEDLKHWPHIKTTY
ncbi:Mitochondrial tRNAs modification protein [Dispira simplex]|nr:Mitochondrial tRNAs modification protein [Dispira simplex]